MLELGNSDSIIPCATTTAYINLLKKKKSTYQFHQFIQSHWCIVVTVSSVYRPQASDWSVLQEHNLNARGSFVNFILSTVDLQRLEQA